METTPVNTDSLDLGNGLTLAKTDPKYQSLVGKGFTDEQIIKAVSKMKTPEAIKGVEKSPILDTNKDITPTKIDNTQLDTGGKIKSDTPPSKIEQDTAKVEKGPELLPVSDYQDDTEARQQGIIANLNNAIQTNPQSLKNQTAFRDYYNYKGRSDLQKKTLDTRYTGYQKGQELSYKDTNDIYKAYNSGNLSSGDLSNLKIVNPVKYEEVNALIDKKNKLTTYQNDLYGPTKTVNPFQTIIDNYTKGLQTLATSNFYKDYKEAMNSAGIKEQKLNIATKQGELDKIDKQINDKKSEIEKRYEGTGATRGKINAIIADELEDLYNMRSNLAIDMNTSISKYNAEAGAIKEDFEMKQAEQQYNMQVKQQQMSELGFAMQLMSYETPAQQDERSWNNFIRQQEYTDGNIYSSDPKTRLRAIEKAVDNTLKEFEGIPMVRSRDQMVDDIKNMVEQGSDLGDAITKNIREPIKDKAEYMAWSANKLGISSADLEAAGMTWNRDNNTKSWKMSKPSSSNVPSSSGVTPTGNYSTIKLQTSGGKSITREVDSVTGNSLSDAFSAMNAAGITPVIGQTKRDQTQTIKDMANRYGIAFNAQNPNETAAKLRKSGHQVADVGKSKHETGMAVDIYSDSKYSAPTQKQIDIMEQNGWKHMDIPGDKGHFEYVGKPGSNITAPTASELLYFDKGMIKKNAKDEGLTQARYNEIDSYKKSQSSTSTNKVGGIDYDTAFSLLSFPTAVKSDQEKANIQKLADAGNTAAVKSKIINLAVNNIEGAESKKDYQSTYTMLGTLDKIQGLLDQAKKLGVPTGYLSGKYEDIANKFGESTNPEIARLGTTLRDQLDALRRGRSGAALTEFEESFYDSIFPSNGKNYDLNTANIKGLKDSRNMIFRTYLENAYTSEIADQLLGTVSSNNVANNIQKNYFSQRQSGVGTSAPQQPAYFNYIIGN